MSWIFSLEACSGTPTLSGTVILNPQDRGQSCRDCRSWNRQGREPEKAEAESRKSPFTVSQCGISMRSVKLEENDRRRKVCPGSRDCAVVQAHAARRSDWTGTPTKHQQHWEEAWAKMSLLGTAKPVKWGLTSSSFLLRFKWMKLVHKQLNCCWDNDDNNCCYLQDGIEIKEGGAWRDGSMIKSHYCFL